MLQYLKDKGFTLDPDFKYLPGYFGMSKNSRDYKITVVFNGESVDGMYTYAWSPIESKWVRIGGCVRKEVPEDLAVMLWYVQTPEERNER